MTRRLCSIELLVELECTNRSGLVMSVIPCYGFRYSVACLMLPKQSLLQQRSKIQIKAHHVNLSGYHIILTRVIKWLPQLPCKSTSTSPHHTSLPLTFLHTAPPYSTSLYFISPHSLLSTLLHSTPLPFTPHYSTPLRSSLLPSISLHFISSPLPSILSSPLSTSFLLSYPLPSLLFPSPPHLFFSLYPHHMSPNPPPFTSLY